MATTRHGQDKLVWGTIKLEGTCRASGTTTPPGSAVSCSQENTARKHRQSGGHRKPDPNLSIGAGPRHKEGQAARRSGVSTYTRSKGNERWQERRL